MKKGFTLVELIIVMVILAALAGAVVPAFTANRAQAQTARMQSDMEAIKSAMYVFRADTGSFPASIAALNAGTTKYLDQGAPTDPCGTAYAYNNTAMGTLSQISRGAASTCPAVTPVTVHE